ncbi:hypothetical protein MRX96_052936 [Rhipicephalus microplus]
MLQTLCSLATIDYAAAHTTDGVRINPYNNSLPISTPSESHARFYLRTLELRLGISYYPLRAYMAAAPDNSLRGIIYTAVDSQVQDEIFQDLQSMNLNTSYAIADVRRVGRSNYIQLPSSALPSSPPRSSLVAASTAATRSAQKSRPASTAGLLAIARTPAQSPCPPLCLKLWPDP